MNNRKHAGRAGVITFALAATSVTALLVSPAAGADVSPTPPWQVSGSAHHDPNALGTLSFFDSDGTQVFSGSATTAPLAAYVVGSHEIRTGDTKAALYGYTPQDNTDEGSFSGEQLTAATTYPNNTAPASVTKTLPSYTGSTNETSLADLISLYPNTSTDAATEDVYELRLRTNAPQNSTTVGYDFVDIKVTGNTWQVVYPAVLPTTTTTLAVTPSGAKVGDSLTLTASVSPAEPGTVQFADDATNLGAPVAVAAGQATITVPATAAGTHVFKASYTPTDTNAFVASDTDSYVIAKAPSTTTATWPTSRAVYGKAFSVKATVSSAGGTPTGSVTLTYGSKKLASKALSSGKATLTVAGTALTAGSRKLVLSYGGSANFDASSTSKTITVAKATSKTTNTLAPKKVPTTKHAKLTVQVVVSGTTATGSVKIYDGTKVIKTVTLTASSKGKVVVTLPKFKAGKHKIHAAYAGSSTVAASSAATVTLKVTKKKK